VPDEIVLKLSRRAALTAHSYLPRQDDGENGCVQDYEVYLSDDGINFGSPVAKGSFDASKGNEQQAIVLPGKACLYIKFKALSEING
jgi:beta-galactosidase